MLQFLGFVLLCFVWGTSWVAIKFSLIGFPPYLGAAGRFLLAAAMLWLYLQFRRARTPAQRGSFLLVAVTGMLVYLVDYGLIYWAEQFLSAGVTAIFFATFPLFVGITSHFLLRGEPFRINVYLGLAIGLAGVTVVFQDALARTAFDRQVVLAVLAVLAAAAAGALSSVLVKKHLSADDPATLSLRQMAVGCVALLGVALLRGEHADAVWDWRALVAVLYLALAASALAFTLYYWLLQQITPVTLSLVVYFTPLVALLFDWLLLGERITPWQLLGMGLVFAGVLASQFHHYRAYRRRWSAPGVRP